MKTQPPSYPPIDREVESGLSSYAIFCDEVRVEDNGKLLLIGTYQDELYVPRYPFWIPGLVIVAVLEAPKGEFPDHVIMRAYLDETKVLEVGPKETDVPIKDSVAKPTNGLPTMVVLRAVLRVPPMLVEKESSLRVRIDIGDRVLRTGVLSITQRPSDQAP